jgi:hypothetical protein
MLEALTRPAGCDRKVWFISLYIFLSLSLSLDAIFAHGLHYLIIALNIAVPLLNTLFQQSKMTMALLGRVGLHIAPCVMFSE